MFEPSSRYYHLETATLRLPNGREVVYVLRRFLPAPEAVPAAGETLVGPGDHLDHIAARTLGDPELFWRICDANGALRPDELTEVIGRRVRITLPDGVKGPRT